MTTLRILTIATATVALAAWGSPRLHAQAMVGYGHAVSKAGAAGAAAGAGIAGALHKLQRPLTELDKQRSSSSARRRGATTKTTGANDVRWDVGSSSMQLAGGVTASGLTTASWSPVLVGSNQSVAVLSEEWSENEPAAQPAEAAEAAQAQQESTEARSPAIALIPREGGPAKRPAIRRAAAVSTDSSSAPDQTAAAPALPVVQKSPVNVGMTLDQLFAELGTPKLVFRGVAGQGYTDHFVFRLDDGTQVVVYVLDGLVSSFDIA